MLIQTFVRIGVEIMPKHNQRVIMMADMQSFYASVEKARNPKLKNKPVVVAGDPSRRSGIILAACPIAKKNGVKTAEALWQSLQKCPDLVVIQPRMQDYLKVSMRILDIVNQFTDLAEPYSVDELFFDCTGVQSIFGSPEEIAKQIQSKIMIETGVYARVGIGENKTLAKLCTDLIAKKIEGGIFHLNKYELDKHIWHFPASEMWGVGSRMTAHLAKLGIFTIGDLAKTPLHILKQKFRARMGRNSDIQAELLWQVANGMDSSPVTPSTHDGQKVIGNGMTLPRDYRESWEIEIVLLELTNQVCRRARSKNCLGSVVSVSCMGADWDNMTGFNRQMKLPTASNTSTEVFEVAKEVFKKYWDEQPVRRLGVALSDLSDASVRQLSIFDLDSKQFKIDSVMDRIKDRFGESSILRASSLTSAGQAMDRAAKIGGHYK